MSKHSTAEQKLHISEPVQPKKVAKKDLKKSTVPPAYPAKGTNVDNQYR